MGLKVVAEKEQTIWRKQEQLLGVDVESITTVTEIFLGRLPRPEDTADVVDGVGRAEGKWCQVNERGD
jgi:hypothetical protein